MSEKKSEVKENKKIELTCADCGRKFSIEKGQEELIHGCPFCGGEDFGFKNPDDSDKVTVIENHFDSPGGAFPNPTGGWNYYEDGNWFWNLLDTFCDWISSIFGGY